MNPRTYRRTPRPGATAGLGLVAAVVGVLVGLAMMHVLAGPGAAGRHHGALVLPASGSVIETHAHAEDGAMWPGRTADPVGLTDADEGANDLVMSVCLGALGVFALAALLVRRRLGRRGTVTVVVGSVRDVLAPIEAYRPRARDPLELGVCRT